MLRVRKTLAIATMLLGALTLPLLSTAAAESPGRLDADHITDHADVLTDAEEADLEQKLAKLASTDDRPELFVVLVDYFESPSNALEWADDAAMANNLGSDQYLLAIATEGRSLAISAEYGGGSVKPGPLSESRVLDIEDELGSDYLRTDDWAGGIAFVAEEFDEVPWPWWVWVLGIAAFAAVIFIVVWIVNALKSRAARVAEMRTLEGQKKVAARRLVLSDEAVRTSEQELGFVTAEFGEDATTEFRSVIEQCRTRLREGFDVLEKLEDSIEDTLDETREWTNQILRLCDENDKVLEERKRALGSLRALAEGAQKNLDRLTAERAAAANLEQDARAQLDSLSTAVEPAELVGVISNPEEISQRLRDADVQLEKLAAAVKTRKPRAISKAVHEVERLLAEAKDLRTAIGAQAEALAGRESAVAGLAEGGAEFGSDYVKSVPSGPATLEQAAAAVRAAEASAQARVGTVSALALSRLNLARRQLDSARTADNAAKAQTLTDSAFGLAQQVQALIKMPVAPGPSRSTAPQGAGSTPHVVYHNPSPRPHWSTTTASSESEGAGGRAISGALGGGAVGLFSGFGIADGESGAGGAVLVCVIIGVIIGALAGAFGNGESGGSSSGWSGSSSSRRSWSSGSRSSSSSRSSGRRSGGGSRSSGRSGGRRF